MLAHDAQLGQVVDVVIEQRHLGDLDAGRALGEPPELAPLRGRQRAERARTGASRAAASSIVAADSAAAAASARSAAAIASAIARPGAAWTRFATKPASPIPAARSRSWKYSASSIAATSGTSTSRKPTLGPRSSLSTDSRAREEAGQHLLKIDQERAHVVEETAADQLREPAHQKARRPNAAAAARSAWPPRAGARTRSARGWTPRPRSARGPPENRARSRSAACRARPDRTRPLATKSCSASVAAYSCEPVTIVVICR